MPVEFETILTITERRGYEFEYLNFETSCVGVFNQTCKVTIYPVKDRFTVTTCLVHPLKGPTQLHRRGITLQELDLILENPRVHLGKGYYRKKQVKNARSN